MGALNEFLVRQIQEAERIAKPLREMQAAITGHLGIVDEQYRAAIAAFDVSPIREALRQFEEKNQLTKSLAGVGGLIESAQESARRMQETVAKLTAGLPTDLWSSMLTPDWPNQSTFLGSLPPQFDLMSHLEDLMPEVGPEPEEPPKRPIGFIDTNGM